MEAATIQVCCASPKYTFIKAHALFVISTTTSVRDGLSTRFWTDRWLHGKAICELAPTLMPYVRRRRWRTLTVQAALEVDRGTKDIIGGLFAPAYWQYL